MVVRRPQEAQIAAAVEVTDATELDDLSALTEHPGWIRFLAHTKGEWGQGGSRYVQAVEACANRPDDTLALRTLQQIIVAQKEIARAMSWPEERISQVRQQVKATATSGQSRRGVGL